MEESEYPQGNHVESATVADPQNREEMIEYDQPASREDGADSDRDEEKVEAVEYLNEESGVGDNVLKELAEYEEDVEDLTKSNVVDDEASPDDHGREEAEQSSGDEDPLEAASIEAITTIRNARMILKLS